LQFHNAYNHLFDEYEGDGSYHPGFNSRSQPSFKSIIFELKDRNYVLGKKDFKVKNVPTT